MTWQAITELAHIRFGWRTEAEIEGIDPYVVWADGTDFAGFGRPITTGKGYPFLIELESTSIPPCSETLGIALQRLRHFQVSPLYAKLPLHPRVSFSALVPARAVRRLKSAGNLRIRAVLSLPRIAQYAEIPQILSNPVHVPCIAVIDDGCPFAHAQLRDANGRSRVRFLWDQGQDHVSGDGWTSPLNLGYGRELDGAAIDDLLAANTVDGEVDEDACYMDVGYDAVRPRSTHGSVITDLAAGSPSPLAPPGSAPDAAAQAPIVFVQLPRFAVDDPSGGALHSFVLDALRYIENRTSQGPTRHPVAINLSYGTMAGPHDGTSPLEVAIDDFLAARKDCAVVIAAGNGYEAMGHARASVQNGHPLPLRWEVAPGDGTDSFMEIWLPDKDDLGFPPAVSVRLVPPGVDPLLCPWVGALQARFGLPGPGPGLPACGVIHPGKVPNGKHGTMVLLAVGPTQDQDGGRVPAPAGTWLVEVRNEGTGAVEIHAWIERDDPSLNGRAKQSRFDPQLACLSRENTLGSFAHGQHSIVAGACLDDAEAGQPVARYSGSGPGRDGHARDGPDVIAGADESEALPGLRAAGTRSGDSVRMSGTSVAAAVVTREVMNSVLAGHAPGQTSTQIKAALPVNPPRDVMAEGPQRVGRGRIKSLR